MKKGKVSILINRKEAIKSKGFKMPIASDTRETIGPSYEAMNFANIRVGAKVLDDAIVDLGDLKKINKNLASKENVLKAIMNCDYEQMREISNFFYNTSGIYSRLCRYLAYLYRYDWMITPYLNDMENEKVIDKALDGFYEALTYLDNFGVKKFFGEVALKVIKNGCFYGYLIPTSKKMNIQELPANYCRSRFTVNGRPAVEFNMKFFDETFREANQRMKMLNLFPKEFKKGYVLYKEGKLPPQFSGDASGWYLLETNNVIKFNINGEDFPAFVSVIPAIIDLDEAQNLDRKKMAQELLKIIIQKMPLDKNGDLVFDVDEAQQLHNNAVNMLGKAIGVDVLTTFADVEVADMDNNRAATSRDDLVRVERSVYNEAGVSQMQFNTDGNIALEKSILNDEASLFNLIIQFEEFLNKLVEKFDKNKKYNFRVQLLPTTIYNYKELSKLYKEHTQMGYSKMLPQIALGQAQSAILANAYFENDVLDLAHLFIPPMTSNQMNVDSLTTLKGNDKGGNPEKKEGGRPTKESQGETVTEKTIQNKESQN